MTKAAEIVTFRLKPEATPDAFRAAMDTMQPFVDRHGGVISRTLSCDDTGLWTDHILWESLEAAQSLAAQFMEAPETQAARDLIDGPTVEMRHAMVHMQKG
ncbi:hypothetical protein KUV51_04585 [Tateyamaria omphalii]|uniref:antibiotic biosynthesis monooxygenase family protein n=1 Tax=Tateyamaria omphalii TaxID=299262 RepID=UPI001C998DFB|nr:hypothetical protein [Tateyamaria omphalii]MBY5932268.1 hypothetical protein [Tateyamaria omphalii]